MKYLVVFLIASYCYIPNNDPQILPLNKKQKKEFKKTFAYIPSGQLKTGKASISIKGFFMQVHEVTNLQYKEFLTALNANGQDELAKIYKPVFDNNTSGEKIENTYFLHPAYDDYPVKGISHESATAYCKWLKSKLSEQYNMDLRKINVQLPNQTQWTYAAKGGHDLAPYSWGGYYIRNAKGCFLANFNHALGTTSITKNQESGEYEIIQPTGHLQSRLSTSPAVTYFPNDYGLYNMCGNVAEMISDEGIAMGGSYKSTGYDIRTVSSMSYSDLSDEVGFRPIVIFN